ncbi:MAG: DUF6514 family protein [Acutalibacteraceae bacterium]|nr:DUF6514 family protein [Acutalibacteraceae bacterium]
MVTYQIIKELINHPELGNYYSYGICAFLDKKEIAHISDVFLEKDTAIKFVQKCNQLKLDPIHLSEVIENELLTLHI